MSLFPALTVPPALHPVPGVREALQAQAEGDFTLYGMTTTEALALVDRVTDADVAGELDGLELEQALVASDLAHCRAIHGRAF